MDMTLDRSFIQSIQISYEFPFSYPMPQPGYPPYMGGGAPYPSGGAPYPPGKLIFFDSTEMK